MSPADREIMSAFLSEGSTAEYVPRAGEIIGILKQMKDEMEKSLAEINAAEKQAIADFNALVGAKTQEIAANTEAIETKTARSGRVSLEIVDLKEGLDDTAKALYADRKFLADLDR